jgi:hypothetical protein
MENNQVDRKIAAKNSRKTIENFEDEPEIAELRDHIKEAAEKQQALKILSFTGNSYGSTFFEQMETYINQIPSIEVIS